MPALIDFIRDSLEHLHSWWDDALGDLTPEQLHYVPDHCGNHIGFIVWHVVRTEDNLVQFVFQNRTPTIWLQGGYDAKFGLHRTSQGTGMTAEEAEALRLPALSQWMEYQNAVWQATGAWLGTQSEADLLRVVRINPFGEQTIVWALRSMILNHGFIHLGEAHHLRALQGLKTTPF